MTNPYQQVPNSDNSPAGQGNMSMLNLNGVGNGNQTPYTIPRVQPINLDPQNQPPVMKTFVYSPEVKVLIATENGMEFDVSADLVRGQLFRAENSASTFVCELTNKDGQYTNNGGMFSRMDRITVYMKRVSWVQVFSGYLDTVPFAQMWAGNVNLKATCTLKRLLYTYWNPNLTQSQLIFNQINILSQIDIQGASTDAGLGDLLGNLICWVGGWQPQNVHIQEFPLVFFESMKAEFLKYDRMGGAGLDAFNTALLGYDHTAGPGSAAGIKNLSTGPGLGPQVIGAPLLKQQVIKAVDDLGMGPNTQDIQTSYSIQEFSATGQSTEEAAVAQAYQQQASLATTLQTQARTTDAAILAFACVMGESGPGWQMWANAAVPESLNYPHDAIGSDHDSIGLFQQRNQGWGTVAQRMNAYASAVMFLDALSKLDWRNMDPAEAISRVQRNRDGAITYRPHIAIATQEVQAIRAGQGRFVPQSTAGIGTSSIEAATSGQSIVGAASTAINGVPGISQNSPAPGALPVSMPGKPIPDAQGAVNAATIAAAGKPFKLGGNSPLEGFDGPGLINYAYNTIGIDVGRTASQQATKYKQKVPSLALAQPGDVIEVNGGQHVALVAAPAGTGIIDVQPGGIVKPGPIWFNPLEITGIYRYADWGGPDPSAPFNPAAGPGMPVGTGNVGSAVGGGSDGAQEPIARNLFSYIFSPANYAPVIADLFSGDKSFIDSEPLIQEVQAVARSGLRNFCSAPNGDFIAYYPDYFGVDGKPIAMTIENIEMKDVRINLSDDAMTTHVYVAGDFTQHGMTPQASAWLQSRGVATVENETLFQRLRRVVPGGAEGLTGAGILQKYGVRPLQLEFSSIGSFQLEFLVACQLFMQKWAEQYETTASFTFMPELFPGMRVALGETGIAVYVSDVTHTFDWEEGFTTTAKIMAPSAVNGGRLVTGVVPNVAADATNMNPIPTPVPGG